MSVSGADDGGREPTLTPRGQEMLEEYVAWRLSGVSIRAYCEGRSLKFGTLGWGGRRLAEQGVDLEAAVAQAREEAAAEAPGGPIVAGTPGELERLPPVLEPGEEDPAPDLTSPEWYLNRELTWLSFNERVLAEAEDPRTPLLERVKFLSIVGSNLDEFMMKRVGGLMQQAGAGMSRLTVDGPDPVGQIRACRDRIRPLRSREETLLEVLAAELAERGVRLATYGELSGEQQAEARSLYEREIYPLVTPQAMDPAHPFPFVSNLSLNLLVSLHYPGNEDPALARVKVPLGSGTPRFMELPGTGIYLRLEEVMAHNLDLLFPGMEVDSCELFRVTRNANTETDEGKADDLLAMIEGEVRDRKFAPIVRLEVEPSMDATRRGMLGAQFGLAEEDVYEAGGLFGMRDLMEIFSLDRPDLKDALHHPVDHPALPPSRNIFHTIRDQGSILLAHPYDSFATSVERFLSEASTDPQVRAIKTTLYRTAEDSRVIAHLLNAARNGKQVAVVVELKARFDEQANIRWAHHLESAGIHVTYGVLGLKTHCKCILVVRRDYAGLRRYAHVGTGNYHSGTARLYSDFGLLTCEEAIGQDLTELFNFLTTGYRPKRRYNQLLVAPRSIKKALLKKIRREVEHHKDRGGGRIVLKTNALEDADITRALYEASAAGVRVELIVRDSCRIRPGIPGVSDNVSVLSVVGRFLEHARIYYFHNGGADEYYIGSADAMKRNLESRVEVLVPVTAPELCMQLRRFLELQLADHRSAWEMQSDGSYVQRRPPTPKAGLSSQEAMIRWTKDRARRAAKHEKPARLRSRMRRKRR